MIKRVLCIDGGGVKGFVPIMVLKAIEERTGKRIADLFDLVVGTSVGAILGAAAASGKYSMAEIYEQMLKVVPAMFTRQLFPPFPKYSRKKFVDFWQKTYGDIKMSDCRCRYLCTSVDIVTGNTHYFKSWEAKDGKMAVLDAVLCSFAAPVFFGSIVDEKDKRVWVDGGTGEENCPVLEALIESLRQGWLGACRMHLLSLGTGSASCSTPFAKAKNYGALRQALFFLDLNDGGLARQQSTQNAVDISFQLGNLLSGYTMQRLDAVISKKIDKLDGIAHINSYITLGQTLAAEVDYELIGLQ